MIQGFQKFPHLETWKGRPAPKSTFWEAKEKLHGTNAAVRIEPDGQIYAQSRNRDVTVDADNNGFAAFVASERPFWAEVARRALTLYEGGVVIYGEWAGPGIQAGEAVHKLPRPIFFPFAMRTHQGLHYTAATYFETLFNPLPERVVPLPFLGISTADPSADAESLSEIVEKIGERSVFIRTRFGIEGPGEGLVFYPFNEDGTPGHPDLIFKAKSSRHTERKGEPAVRSRPSAPAGDVAAFVDRYLTEARLQKAVAEIGFQREKTGDFLAYVSRDILRECEEDLGELPWKQVASAISKLARDWYFRNGGAL